MKFVHFDMLHNETETKKPIVELWVFNGFELFVDWKFSEAASFLPKVCPTNLHQ